MDSAEDDLMRLPAMLTLDEVAGVLRIGRSLAYELARRYEVTLGAEGVPVIRVGSSFRTPRWALIELVRDGTVARLGKGNEFAPSEIQVVAN